MSVKPRAVPPFPVQTRLEPTSVQRVALEGFYRLALLYPTVVVPENWAVKLPLDPLNGVFPVSLNASIRTFSRWKVAPASLSKSMPPIE